MEINTVEGIATDFENWRDKVDAFVSQDIKDQSALLIKIARNKALLAAINAALDSYRPIRD